MDGRSVIICIEELREKKEYEKIHEIFPNIDFQVYYNASKEAVVENQSTFQVVHGNHIKCSISMPGSSSKL